MTLLGYVDRPSAAHRPDGFERHTDPRQHGFEFDVVTDHDLHREGLDLIRDYAVLLTGSHPDYLALVEDVLQIRGPVWGSHPLVRADIVLVPRADRGSVFSVGSISWTASLCWNDYTNNVSTVTRNVLTAFMR